MCELMMARFFRPSAKGLPFARRKKGKKGGKVPILEANTQNRSAPFFQASSYKIKIVSSKDPIV